MEQTNTFFRTCKLLDTFQTKTMKLKNNTAQWYFHRSLKFYTHCDLIYKCVKSSSKKA